MSTHNICFCGDALLMSTHNICFCGEIRKLSGAINYILDHIGCVK